MKKGATFEIDGRQMTIAEVVEETGLSDPTVRHRIKRGATTLEQIKRPIKQTVNRAWNKYEARS